MQRVVAAVIEQDGRYLLCQRPAGKCHAGLWEFPGGKVHDGESDADAVRRELMEELGTLPTNYPLLVAEHPDEASGFLICFLKTRIEGEPECLEHESIGWFLPHEVREVELAPADKVFATNAIFGNSQNPTLA